MLYAIEGDCKLIYFYLLTCAKPYSAKFNTLRLVSLLARSQQLKLSVLTKRKTIYEARMYSNNLETANHIAHVIFVLHSAMKTHLLTNQNARIMNYSVKGDY